MTNILDIDPNVTRFVNRPFFIGFEIFFSQNWSEFNFQQLLFKELSSIYRNKAYRRTRIQELKKILIFENC